MHCNQDQMLYILQQTDRVDTNAALSRERNPSLPPSTSGWVQTRPLTLPSFASSSLGVRASTLSSTPAGWITGNTSTPPDVSMVERTCTICITVIAHVSSGKGAVYFTTDGKREWELSCGITPPLFATVDFSPADNMTEILARFRKHQTSGPLVNSELYSGWCDWYGQPHQTTGG